MTRSVVIAVLVILAAWVAGGWLDKGTPAGAPVHHALKNCSTPYGAIGQFITVNPKTGNAVYGTHGNSRYVFICTSNDGWQHV